jgi:hypothetical protein
MAGGIIFAWMDEWWKRNWMVTDRYSPPERNRLWLNAMDPEQHYGLLAAIPGTSGWKIVLDGRLGDWRDTPDLYARHARETRSGPGLHRFKVTHDEAYLYLMIELEAQGSAAAESEHHVWVGIDTYDAARGDRRFPDPVGVTVPIGMEFLIRFDGRDSSRLLVDAPYYIASRSAGRPCRSEPNEDGKFIGIEAEANRKRWGRDGTVYPARTYDRGPLRFGSTDPASPEYTSLADWYRSPDGTRIEARIPWGLLNVSDPSSHHVIHEQTRTEGPVEAVRTEGFRFHVLLLDDDDDRHARVVDSFPAHSAPGNAAAYPLFNWPGWERPTYHLRLKQSYFILKEAWAEF